MFIDGHVEAGNVKGGGEGRRVRIVPLQLEILARADGP